MASALLVFVLCLASGLMISVDGRRISKRADYRCPLGWSHYNNRCFLFKPRPMAWSDAERHCTLLDGNLASIQTRGDYFFLRRLIQRATYRHRETWLGGYDCPKNKVWLWSDGSKFDFKLWGRGEPNNANRGEGCMEMNFRGRDYINDAKCNQRRFFVCAKQP